MKSVTTSHAILQLRKKEYLWRQFIAETRDRGYVTYAVDLLRAGKGHELITETLTAFDIGDAEARAWLAYFRGIGAIASENKVNHGSESYAESF